MTRLFPSFLFSSSLSRASLWPKQPIWVGRLRVVSRGSKCAVLLEHTDKDGLFASCPIQDSRTVEPAVDSSRYFVLRLSDGKGRHALIGIGFNDRAQAFDFKVSLQDYENQNREGGALVESGSKHDYSIPEGGSIHVNIGSSGEKKKKKSISSSGAMDVSTAMAGLKLEGDKEKKKKKKVRKLKQKEEQLNPPILSHLFMCFFFCSLIVSFFGVSVEGQGDERG